MSTGNGLALILFGDPKIEYSRYKGGTRSTKGAAHSSFSLPEETLVDVDDEVAKFEEFLTHCVFILQSSKSKTRVALHTTDISHNGARPNGQRLLPKVNVEHWKIVLSRYRFHVHENDYAKLEQEYAWTLCLLDITKPGYGEGNEYIASVVCFPQSWLSWIDNEWFLNNLQRYWFIQGSDEDTFGIPSLQSTRDKHTSNCADGRHYFRICNVQITETTNINEGATAVDVSEERLQTGYTDHHKGIYFPQDGLMYVLLVDLPSTYKIARHEVSSLRECVMCGDERPHNDRGLVFGTCGHYICHECCCEYQNKLNEVTKCFYCRRPTFVKLDGVDLNQELEPELPRKRPHSVVATDTAVNMIIHRLQQI